MPLATVRLATSAATVCAPDLMQRAAGICEFHNRRLDCGGSSDVPHNNRGRP